MRVQLHQLLLAALVALLLPGAALAQVGQIRGTVFDETGEPLPGANVRIEALNIGAATGIDGTYNLPDVPIGTHTVAVTFVGFQTLSEDVNVSQNTVTTQNFTLQEGVELTQVVVDGYRVTRAPIESGATSFVEGAELETLTARSPDQAVQGRLSGVRVTSTSGQPGAAMSFQIRGSGSISAGNDPLYIIDGVQISNNNELSLASGNPLTAISPNDIESIEVLKDAAATSIYGAEAANGVVLITTKRGRAGQGTQIEFSTQLGVRDRLREFDVLSSNEYLGYLFEMLTNTGFSAGFAEGFIPANFCYGGTTCTASLDANGNFVPDASVNTDWQEELFRQGLTQTYNVSARGGNESTQFFISGRYADDESQILGSGLDQVGLRLNLDHNIGTRATLEARINVATTEVEGQIGGGAFINGPSFSSQFIIPTAPVYATPGDPSSGFNLNTDPFAGVFSYNPIAQLTFDTRRATSNQILGNVAANVELIDNLFARSFIGVNHFDSQEEQYRDPRQPQNRGTSNFGQILADRTTEFNASQTLSYSTLLNTIHNVSGLAGVEYRRGFQDDFSTVARSFPTFAFRTLNSAATIDGGGGAKTEFRRFSLFGNAEYTFDNRYQITSTLRYDGSSRFGDQQRFGLFGTIGGFWRISEEAFAENISLLNDLKLRASYGVTGNSEIGNYAARVLFAGAGEYAGLPGVRLSNLANPNLTWEERREFNVGLDFELFSGRFGGSVDAYDATVDELLLGRDLPSDSGIGFFTENIGAVGQRGIEIALRSVNLRMGDFEWASNFNITFQDAEVEELVGGDDEIVVGGLVYRVGEAPGQLEFIRYAGVNPANGRPLYFDANGNLTYNATREEDQVLVGNSDPDYFGGFGNTFRYGGLSLDAFFQFDFGRTLLNNDRYFNEVNAFWYANRSSAILDAWEQPGDITNVPIAVLNGAYSDGLEENEFSTRFVEDASYVRLKQLTLSYSVPTSLLGSVPALRSARIFVQGENLLTWTEFTGEDPEVVGSYIGEFPQSKVFTAGLRLGL